MQRRGRKKNFYKIAQVNHCLKMGFSIFHQANHCTRMWIKNYPVVWYEIVLERKIATTERKGFISQISMRRRGRKKYFNKIAKVNHCLKTGFSMFHQANHCTPIWIKNYPVVWYEIVLERKIATTERKGSIVL